MTTNVIEVDFERKLIRGPITAMHETRDQIVKREVLTRCQRLGDIPGDLAHYYANQAAQIVRRNPARETSSLVENAVRQAIATSRARNTDPTKPFAA